MTFSDAMCALIVEVEELEAAYTALRVSHSPAEKVAAAAFVARMLIRVGDATAYAQEWMRRENTAP